MYQTSLFIFRRDLRLEDNRGLIQALKNSQQVIPCFIFTPEQTKNNPYKSEHCFQFMCTALQNLEDALKDKGARLYCFYGKPDAVVAQCIQELNIDAVFVNRDYTPYSLQRDHLIEIECIKHQIPFISTDDALLQPPEDTLKKDGKPYLVFTPFYHHVRDFPVEKPVQNRLKNYFSEKIRFCFPREIIKEPPLLRKECLKILANPPQEATGLSPFLKFTICSPREAYWAFEKKWGKDCSLIKELYWRDFFTSIAFFFPHVFKGAFRAQYNAVSWSKNKKNFQRWCTGTTGFPLIDAAMRELSQTGQMSNRMRMATASFLVKDLHIHWQWGEHYFAQTLIDYDPAVNNGNWQWVAGTGTDAQPYFRVFNPWTQQKKLDPECTYIKKWIPELRSISPKMIHSWSDSFSCLPTSYPPPMLDHKQEAANALILYKNL